MTMNIDLQPNTIVKPRCRQRVTYPHDSLVAQVGRRIRALRNEQGVSLRDFGKLAGVHHFHVMEIELGQASANTRTLRAIAKGLGVSLADLINHGGDGDIGQIFELLRKRPELVSTCIAKLTSSTEATKAET